jgi:hypothetical protein
MSERRALVQVTLDEVVFKGLEEQGISTQPARDWLTHPAWPESHYGH